ncbi:hypothetical protein BgiBS90_035247 [Biomphalaria glabrata]|nr:hypothetical protein BgiBS90_035247 [Biomphalaria glabrata]
MPTYVQLILLKMRNIIFISLKLWPMQPLPTPCCCRDAMVNLYLQRASGTVQACAKMVGLLLCLLGPKMLLQLSCIKV